MFSAAARIAHPRSGVRAASLRQLTSATVAAPVCARSYGQQPSYLPRRELHTTPSVLEPSTQEAIGGESVSAQNRTERRPPRTYVRPRPKDQQRTTDGENELATLIPNPDGTASVVLKDGTTVLNMRYTKHLMAFAPIEYQALAFRPNQLRDTCACSACRDASSGQKSFATTEVPMDMEITNVQTTDNGGLTVTVDKDMDRHGGAKGHDIYLSPDWLWSIYYPNANPATSKTNMMHRFKRTFWDKETMEQDVQRIDYEQFMQKDSKEFWDVIQALVQYGLVFLKNVPRDEKSIERITTRIANIRETFYGRTFDVKAKPNAENVAYTSGYLGLHQDLLYLDPPPHVQLLHCMDNSCTGGESLFSDADRIGRMLYFNRNSQSVKALSRSTMAYGYKRNGYFYGKERKVLDLSRKRKRLLSLFWSPPFQAELTSPITDLDMWTAGARVLESALNDPQNVYERRLEPGECVLFDNLRVLHGRKAFDAEGGSRWLRGAYIGFEDFWSTAMHAPESHAKPLHRPREWYKLNESDRHLGQSPAFRKIKKNIRKEEMEVIKARANRMTDQNEGLFQQGQNSLKRLRQSEMEETSWEEHLQN